MIKNKRLRLFDHYIVVQCSYILCVYVTHMHKLTSLMQLPLSGFILICEVIMCLNSDVVVLSPVLPRVSGAGGEAWLGGSPVRVHVPQQGVSQWLWPHPSVR